MESFFLEESDFQCKQEPCDWPVHNDDGDSASGSDPLRESFKNESLQVDDDLRNEEVRVAEIKSETPCHDTTTNEDQGSGLDENSPSPIPSGLAKEAHSCEICHKQFTRLRDLRRHNLVHSEEKPHQCGCGANFARRDNLIKHVKRSVKRGESNCSVPVSVTVQKEKGRICEVCGKKFEKTTHFARHMRGHAGERQHLCSICGRAFIHSEHLQKHMYSHLDENPYVCTQCNKSFRYRDSLSRHMVTHSGVKPHNCEICGAQFYQHGDLTRHMTVHSSDKPYSCEVCEKKFSRPDYLRNHMIVHTEKTFDCGYCSKKFRKLESLKEHFKVHSGIDYCECPVCHLSFPSQSSLSDHIATTHANSED